MLPAEDMAECCPQENVPLAVHFFSLPSGELRFCHADDFQIRLPAPKCFPGWI